MQMNYDYNPTAHSILNVWLVAPKVYPAIQDWMQNNRCVFSICGGETFDDESLVNGAKQASTQMGERTMQLALNCRCFLVAKGTSEVGGSVAVVVGTK